MDLKTPDEIVALFLKDKQHIDKLYLSKKQVKWLFDTWRATSGHYTRAVGRYHDRSWRLTRFWHGGGLLELTEKDICALCQQQSGKYRWSDTSFICQSCKDRIG